MEALVIGLLRLASSIQDISSTNFLRMLKLVELLKTTQMDENLLLHSLDRPFTVDDVKEKFFQRPQTDEPKPLAAHYMQPLAEVWERVAQRLTSQPRLLRASMLFNWMAAFRQGYKSAKVKAAEKVEKVQLRQTRKALEQLAGHTCAQRKF